jgi:dihydrofolate reductase
MIAAVADNGVIGFKNGLPWRLNSDLKFFRTVTNGFPVIMGRKTYDSLGKALPNRGNIVITRDKDLLLPDAVVVNDLDYALELCSDFGRAFVIGGAEIFSQAMDKMDFLYISHVHASPKGDAKFPEIPKKDWDPVSSTVFREGALDDHDFDITIYARTT